MASPDALDAHEAPDFADRYAVSGEAALLAAELESLGSDYQANGYTTIAQAQDLGRLLELRPGRTLADVGSGCGWPGLYLARRHGCRSVGLEPVAEGARASQARARRDNQHGTCSVVRATGIELPLRTGSVDAVVHTDVLC